MIYILMTVFFLITAVFLNKYGKKRPVNLFHIAPFNLFWFLYWLRFAEDKSEIFYVFILGAAYTLILFNQLSKLETKKLALKWRIKDK